MRHAIFLVAVAVALAGCEQTEGTEVGISRPPLPNNQPLEYSGQSMDELIAARADEYAQVKQEAFERGIGAGIIRGAVFGILVDGSAAAIFGGALIGGVMGAAAADQVASQLTIEHKNYVVTRWSLEQVIDAARQDRKQTSFDLVLSSQTVEASRSLGRIVVSRSSFDSILEMERLSSLRLLSLREAQQIYGDQDRSGNLATEYAEQERLVGALRANIHELETIGWGE